MRCVALFQFDPLALCVALFFIKNDNATTLSMANLAAMVLALIRPSRFLFLCSVREKSFFWIHTFYICRKKEQGNAQFCLPSVFKWTNINNNSLPLIVASLFTTKECQYFSKTEKSKRETSTIIQIHNFSNIRIMENEVFSISLDNRCWS